MESRVPLRALRRVRLLGPVLFGMLPSPGLESASHAAYGLKAFLQKKRGAASAVVAVVAINDHGLGAIGFFEEVFNGRVADVYGARNVRGLIATAIANIHEKGCAFGEPLGRDVHVNFGYFHAPDGNKSQGCQEGACV